MLTGDCLVNQPGSASMLKNAMTIRKKKKKEAHETDEK